MSKKVLIIDDSPQDRANMAAVIADHNDLEVSFAFTGEEGINKAQLEKPDYVVIDVTLPDMHGFDVCKKLNHLADLNSKYILITGSIDAIDIAGARAAGANDFIVKTFDFQSLNKSLTNFKSRIK